MDSDDSFFEKTYPNLLEAEREMERENEKYCLGRKISEQLKDSGIDEHNQFEIDNYFELRPPSHLEAFAFYQNYITGLEQTLTQNNEPSEREIHFTPDAFAQAIFKHQNQKYTESENPTIEELFPLWEKEKKASMAVSSFAEYGRETRFLCELLLNTIKVSHQGPLTSM